MMPLVLALVALALTLFVFRPLAPPWLNTLSRSHIWLLDALLFNTRRGMAERMLAISGDAEWASSFEDLDRVDLGESGVLVGGLA